MAMGRFLPAADLLGLVLILRRQPLCLCSNTTFLRRAMGPLLTAMEQVRFLLCHMPRVILHLLPNAHRGILEVLLAVHGRLRRRIHLAFGIDGILGHPLIDCGKTLSIRADGVGFRLRLAACSGFAGLEVGGVLGVVSAGVLPQASTNGHTSEVMEPGLVCILPTIS